MCILTFKTIGNGWLTLLLVGLVFTSCTSDSSDLNEDSLRIILEEVCTENGFECSFAIDEQSSLDYQFSAKVFATLKDAPFQSIEGVYDNFIYPLDQHLIATGYEEWGIGTPWASYHWKRNESISPPTISLNDVTVWDGLEGAEQALLAALTVGYLWEGREPDTVWVENTNRERCTYTTHYYEGLNPRNRSHPLYAQDWYSSYVLFNMETEVDPGQTLSAFWRYCEEHNLIETPE